MGQKSQIVLSLNTLRCMTMFFFVHQVFIMIYYAKKLIGKRTEFLIFWYQKLKKGLGTFQLIRFELYGQIMRKILQACS